jgi:Fur family ferric uptake transcriptional regulator
MRQSLNKKPGLGGRPEQASQSLRVFLRARGLRMTGEREALVRAALARRSHFTLDELVHDVVRHDTTASRATVYRSLPILIAAGILQPALVTDEPRRFELAFGRKHHDHLWCRRCGKVVEFQSEAIEGLQLEMAARHGFALTGHVLELIGDCAACRRAKGKATPGAARGARVRRPGGSRSRS